MHIKQVIVEGFKTYREQTAVDFQPTLNCIGARTCALASHLFALEQR
jgi:structural maintenance of chromosome 3 (chondroitin sulfate proteoglycan 6)